MDPLTNWEDLVTLKSGSNILPPPEEDLAYYYQDYKDFDNLFDEALTTLQDLDVPSGYTQASAPPQRSPRGSSRSHAHNTSLFRHSKKPSGTAIFGFLDHNRELSLGGAGGEDVSRMIRPPQDNIKSISPSQLARTAHQTHPAISNEQLDFNFDQPLEACKPIELREEDEDDDREQAVRKNDGDIIVTNSNPKSYKFPPDPPEAQGRSSGGRFEHLLGSSPGLRPIHHPKRGAEYPDNIDDVADFEAADFDAAKSRRYVPIPVREPVPDQVLSSPSYRPQNHAGHVPGTNSSEYAQYAQYSPSRPAPYMARPYQGPPKEQSMGRPDALNMDMNTDMNMHMNMHMNMNMNVFLPPPSAASSEASPEPHSPSPQHLSSPLRSHKPDRLESSPLAAKRLFYNPQFFSDEAECYYDQPPSRFASSPVREFPQSSPIRQMNRTETQADDTIIDANETIVQLTPLKNHAPITPSTNKITLEWSPIISPNGKATKDVRRAIQELSPKRMMKKTSLLPPGELDKYWEGPDDDKNFVCVYKNCGKKFTRRYNVRSHIQTHLSDRPFTCTYCPKSFVRQHDLNRHVKSHLVSKHCRCKCGREFTRVEGYRKHLAVGACARAHDDQNGKNLKNGVCKPGSHRTNHETVLDAQTSNRLTEELELFA